MTHPVRACILVTCFVFREPTLTTPDSRAASSLEQTTSTRVKFICQTPPSSVTQADIFRILQHTAFPFRLDSNAPGTTDFIPAGSKRPGAPWPASRQSPGPAVMPVKKHATSAESPPGARPGPGSTEHCRLNCSALSRHGGAGWTGARAGCGVLVGFTGSTYKKCGASSRERRLKSGNATRRLVQRFVRERQGHGDAGDLRVVVEEHHRCVRPTFQRRPHDYATQRKKTTFKRVACQVCDVNHFTCTILVIARCWGVFVLKSFEIRRRRRRHVREKNFCKNSLTHVMTVACVTADSNCCCEIERWKNPFSLRNDGNEA